jgi:hypothetical protein
MVSCSPDDDEDNDRFTGTSGRAKASGLERTYSPAESRH